MIIASVEFASVTHHGDGDETGLTSQLISTLLLSTQPIITPHPRGLRQVRNI